MESSFHYIGAQTPQRFAVDSVLTQELVRGQYLRKRACNRRLRARPGGVPLGERAGLRRGLVLEDADPVLSTKLDAYRDGGCALLSPCHLGAQCRWS